MMFACGNTRSQALAPTGRIVQLEARRVPLGTGPIAAVECIVVVRVIHSAWRLFVHYIPIGVDRFILEQDGEFLGDMAR